MVKKSNISKSSKLWLKRQNKDLFVKKSKQEGYRSRAAYKLLELQSKYNILKQGMMVVDLGAAPGSWSQVASKIIFQHSNSKGKLIALDLLPIVPLKNVDIITGDFTNQLIFNKICSLINENYDSTQVNTTKVDLILSDLAPNMSGVWSVDLPKSIYLSELAMDLVKILLKNNGDFLLKLFNGAGTEKYLTMLKENFSKVIICKPSSSRAESREIYILARGYKYTN